jgi:cytochrome c oxidase subunit 4
MLRPSVLRAGASKLNLLQSTSRTTISRLPAICATQQTRSASHAISNPTLADIERRWEALPPQEQADLWMALRDRMKVDWHELTPQEKKAGQWIFFCEDVPWVGPLFMQALQHFGDRLHWVIVFSCWLLWAAYWIAFGPHGPRAEAPPGENWRILKYTIYCLGASGVLFWLSRHFANPHPKTMSREWQEATNEYMKVRPIIPTLWWFLSELVIVFDYGWLTSAQEQKSEPITGISSPGYKGTGYIQSPPSGKPLDDDE